MVEFMQDSILISLESLHVVSLLLCRDGAQTYKNIVSKKLCSRIYILMMTAYKYKKIKT